MVVNGSRTTYFVLNLNQNPGDMSMRGAVASVQADCSTSRQLTAAHSPVVRPLPEQTHRVFFDSQPAF